MNFKFYTVILSRLCRGLSIKSEHFEICILNSIYNMKKIIIAVIVILVLVFLGYFLFKGNTQAPILEKVVDQESNLLTKEEVAEPSFNIEIEPVSGDPSGQLIITQIYEVIYIDSGYSPEEIKINVGDTVTWENQSSGGSWVGSAMHPTHIVYSGTSLQEHCPDLENITFDECKSSQPGESWSFTFNKKGNWRYHNHVKATHSGVVMVE